MEYNFLLHYITSFVYSFHMPLFICVSGAIFSFCINNKKKYSDFRLFIIKKWKRLMVPYFLIGIFYVMPVMCTLKITNLNPINYIKENIILSKDARHLWFLWTLFFIFIIFRMFYHRYEKSNRLFIGVLLFFISFFSDKLPDPEDRTPDRKNISLQSHLTSGSCALPLYHQMQTQVPAIPLLIPQISASPPKD